MDQDLHTEDSHRRFRLSLPPALQYPMYRRYWLGSLASVAGFQMLMFGQGWLAYELTGSPAFLGTVWIASSVSAILLNLYGGVLADRLDKRAMIIVAEIANAALIFLLAMLTLFDMVEPWHLVVIAFLVGGVGAFDQPARQALYPHLIDRRVMMSAVALNSTIWQGTRIAAPAVAGIVVAVLDTHPAFFLGAAGFFTRALVMFAIKVPPIETERGSSAAQDMVEGLRFVKNNSTFSILIGMTFFNSFFGMAYIVLMPIFAQDILQVGAAGQGWLLSAGGVGALGITTWLSTRDDVARRGAIIVGGATLFGLLIIAFALTSEYVAFYPLALVIMLLMGLSNSAYMMSIMSSLQSLVPDRMRGRVMGLYGMTYNIMPLGGGMMGQVASLIGAPFTLALGGLAVVGFALGPALANKRVRNLGTLLISTEEERTTASVTAEVARQR